MGVLVDHCEINAIEQPMQLLHGQRRHGVDVRPDKSVLLKTLHQHPKAVSLPAQNFYAITSPIPEDVQRLSKRIQPEGLLDQDRQTVKTDPEVDRLAMQVDLQAFVEAEHRSLPSASIIANACCMSQP